MTAARGACVFSTLVAIALSGCDRSFPARVSGRIVLGSAPLTGMVIPLGTGSSASLDAAGHFDARYERLNVSPSTIPLLVVPRSGSPFVLEPERDFSLTKNGAEWVATVDLDAAHAKPVKAIPVTCVAAECKAVIPKTADTCFTQAVAMGPSGVTNVVTRTAFGASGTELAFHVGPEPVIVVAACGAPLDDYVSDVITGRASSDGGP